MVDEVVAGEGVDEVPGAGPVRVGDGHELAVPGAGREPLGPGQEGDAVVGDERGRHQHRRVVAGPRRDRSRRGVAEDEPVEHLVVVRVESVAGMQASSGRR